MLCILPLNYFIGSSYDVSLTLNDVHDIPVGKVSYRPDPVPFNATELPCSSSNSTAGSRTTATVQIPVSSSFLFCVWLTYIHDNLR